LGAGKDLCLPDRSDVITHDWSTHPTAGEYLTRFTFRPTAAKDGCHRINGHGELSLLRAGVWLIDFIFGSCRVTLNDS
jgi:hypothetical protein